MQVCYVFPYESAVKQAVHYDSTPCAIACIVWKRIPCRTMSASQQNIPSCFSFLFRARLLSGWLCLIVWVRLLLSLLVGVRRC
ncbi:hypothetical protein T02_6219 [Trichinella nativa]|uniref:Uncharacterized protein n=1 Tax=Trichinella nativa TaxID=6335 RepID=A0A0V1KTG2_9BILA|nr:hypothetical protein T02_6219 [Trichinella nativa]